MNESLELYPALPELILAGGAMVLLMIGAFAGDRAARPMLLDAIALLLVAGIAIGIVGIILGVILAVPVIAVVAAVVIAGKNAGLSWDVFTITAAVLAAGVVFLIFFFLISLLTVPAIVFFPAYSIYFFAGRYRPLNLALYAPAQSAAVPQTSPPLTPPPLPAV